MQNHADVLVLGAGTIGSSVAYHLNRAGKKVIVLEKKDTATGTAGASGSLLSWFAADPGYRLELELVSEEMFKPLSHELDGDMGLQLNVGNLQVFANELERGMIEQTIRENARDGFEVRMLNNQEARELEPCISPDLLGAVYVPRVHYADPIKLAFAFRNTATRLGAVFVNEAPVLDFIPGNGGVCGVHTPKGDFYGDAVVNCCGSRAGDIAKMLGLDMPIYPKRGQMLITEPAAPFCSREIISATFLTIQNHPELMEDERLMQYNLGFAFEQTDTGTCIIHGTREDVGFNVGNDPGAIELLVQCACQVVPRLKDMSIIRAFSGLRPWVDDGLPIMGESSKIRNFYMCAGHGGGGVFMAPVSGRLMTELITSKETCFDIAPCSPARFER